MGVKYRPPERCHCGGGNVYNGPAKGDGRPEFRCTKCGNTFTCGLSGGKWRVLIPATDPYWLTRREPTL